MGKKKFFNLVTRANIMAQNRQIIEHINSAHKQIGVLEPIRIRLTAEIIQKQYSVTICSTQDPRKMCSKSFSLELDPFEFYWETTKQTILKEFSLATCARGPGRSYDFY